MYYWYWVSATEPCWSAKLVQAMAWCRQETSLYDTLPIPERMLNQIYVVIDVCMSCQASVSQNLVELIQWSTYFFTSQLGAVIARSSRMQYYRLPIYRDWIWYDNQHYTEVKKWSFV